MMKQMDMKYVRLQKKYSPLTERDLRQRAEDGGGVLRGEREVGGRQRRGRRQRGQRQPQHAVLHEQRERGAHLRHGAVGVARLAQRRLHVLQRVRRERRGRRRARRRQRQLQRQRAQPAAFYSDLGALKNLLLYCSQVQELLILINKAQCGTEPGNALQTGPVLGRAEL
ncbi:unnamed protein product [Leptidea sinapis]|uniref:Uncharacterized protein n=1 Tax=Leptidea sinapis TaxID=189913 RepID=A0A5E4QUS7_9NEOP|nr:unnamed protein product [Leptidea sinapis]